MKTNIKHLRVASDAALVRFYQRGSNPAFEMIVLRHEGKLKIYSHRLLRNASLEKEVMQNLWIDVMQSLRKKTYKEKGHFLKWLQTLLYRLICALKRAEKHFVHEFDFENEDMVLQPDVPVFGDDSSNKQLRFAISALQRRLRITVKWHLARNMSFKEIALRLHTTTGYVTSAYSKAIKKMRVKLKVK